MSSQNIIQSPRQDPFNVTQPVLRPQRGLFHSLEMSQMSADKFFINQVSQPTTQISTTTRHNDGTHRHLNAKFTSRHLIVVPPNHCNRFDLSTHSTSQIRLPIRIHFVLNKKTVMAAVVVRPRRGKQCFIIPSDSAAIVSSSSTQTQTYARKIIPSCNCIC